jgi:Protein of unknown function, DUF481
VKIEETSESFLRRLSRKVNLGAVHSQGNDATQYNLASEVEYRRERWGLEESFNSDLSSNTGSKTATRNQLTIIANRLIDHNNYFYSRFAGFLHSSVQGIRHQTNVCAGIGPLIGERKHPE